MQRFYDAEKGFVKVDNIPTIEQNAKTLRRLIGIVAQDPILFDLTISQNIAYGVPPGIEVTHDQIVAAAKAADCHKFILSLSDGYETSVGPGGNTLSRGEKQRICIARAIIRNPKILLLDEATSALDTGGVVKDFKLGSLKGK